MYHRFVSLKSVFLLCLARFRSGGALLRDGISALRYVTAGFALCGALITGIPANAQSGNRDLSRSHQGPRASLSQQRESIAVGYPGTMPKASRPGAQPQIDVTVLPQQVTFLTAFTVYNTTTCAEITPGGWTDNTLPTYGQVSYGTVSGTLGNGACSGITFTFAAIYYDWTATNTSATTDSFAATWSGGGFTQPETFDLSLASVTITDTSSIQLGVVGVQINGPSGVSGNLVITFQGLKNTSSQTFPTLASGSQTLDLTFTSITPDTYSSAVAQWQPSGATVTSPTYTLPQEWVFLRLIRYSQYNTPYEQLCSGGTQSMYIYDRSSCTYVTGALNSQFVSQTQINGTGSSISDGLLKPLGATNARTVCKGKLPPNASSANTFVKVSSVTGSCNTQITADSSVATYPNPTSSSSLLQCGDSLDLVKTVPTLFATRSVADLCPACQGQFNGTDGHIDSYTSNQACKGHGSVVDLGNFYTSDLQ